MNVVAFDTLKLARRLEQAGFSRDQARRAAEALADTFSGELATKGDLTELRTELRADISRLGSDLRTEISNLRWTTAQWIVSAVFINVVTVLGAVAAVWQLARR